MKPTRQTQPFRKSGARPPSPVLDRMLAGKAQPGIGAVLAKTVKKRAGGAQQRMIPRY